MTTQEKPAWENEVQQAWVNADGTLVVKSWRPSTEAKYQPHGGYFTIDAMRPTNAWLTNARG